MPQSIPKRSFHPIPGPPKDYPFLHELMSPLHAEPIAWERKRPRAGEVSLADGVLLAPDFPDPKGLLDTAYRDFALFLEAAGVPASGAYPLQLKETRMEVAESYRIEIDRTRCVVHAADTEGVRRALIHLEDEMLRCNGPLLPMTYINRVPVIRRRIEMEAGMFEHIGLEVLPDAFLNRLAHDGVNGLMLPMDRVYTDRIIPEFGTRPDAMFQALRKRVQRYAQYGIKLFLYLNEPKSFAAGDPLRSKYPDLLGGDAHGLTYYCTSTRRGCAAITKGFRDLVTGIPGLGGLIVICVGERPTHCYSAAYEPEVRRNRCPRCVKRPPQDVLRDTLKAMERGVHAADPTAEFIAWPYSQYLCWGERMTRDAAGKVPPGVILMHNFESATQVRQLGKMRRADDYWLSVPGPSDLFRDCATAARRKGTTVYAKIMTGCSHELASVPYIPVPGNLYRQFQALHKLGADGTLQNWGSGNDPSLMNRAARELAFAPLPASEEAFLLRHARRDWGRHAPTVVRAWKHFRAAYANCPVSIGFSYFGPLHNGPVWPLYLEPRQFKLGGNWRPDLPGGDLIGDCTGYHALDEVIILCTRMRDRWRRGVRLLESLESAAAGNRDREFQIGLARALEIHCESAVNILTFYSLREQLALSRSADRTRLLKSMKTLVQQELDVDRRLLPLAVRFPRLGYCPEAGAYKYSPELIRWRMRELKALLAKEFPRVEKRLQPGNPLFPAYTGETPEGYVYHCRPVGRALRLDGDPSRGVWATLEAAPPLHVDAAQAHNGRVTTWQAGYNDGAIYFGFICREPHMDGMRADPRDPNDLGPDDQVHVVVKPSQFEETRAFLINARGAREYYAGRAMNDVNPRGGTERLSSMAAPQNYRWTTRAIQGEDFWSLTIRIPFASMGLRRGHRQPLRFSIARVADLLGCPERQSLLPPPADPGQEQWGWLVFGDE